jgi:hypothetical protein
MNASWKNRSLVAAVAIVVVAALIGLARLQPAQAARDDAPLTGPRYSVVDSEAHNLIVTDNKTNTLYFYTIDKDKEIGSDLKLRGTIDLSQVGKTAITPTKNAPAQ